MSVFEVWGIVKWFDVVKGYGFIILVDGLGDIFFYMICLKEVGYIIVYEGVIVVCEVVMSLKGL